MNEQHFNDKFPLPIIATLAIIQMFTTFSIFALEIGHNILQIKLTNLFVGFWATIPFTILWISMFSVVCCCRRKSCATHAVIQNILGLIFSLILIGFNIAFIYQPNKCFFTENICRKLSWTSYISDTIECVVDGLTTGCGNTRISLIIAQLASAILMATTCLIYLAIYITIFLRKSKKNRRQQVTHENSLLTSTSLSNSKPIPITINHHHHQMCTLSSYPYSGTLPILMSVYPSQTPALQSESTYVNCMPSNYYSTIYPQSGNERF